NGQRVPLAFVVPDVADVEVSTVIDRDVFPIVQRRANNGEECARVTLTVDGVKQLFLRPATVVVRPVHIGVPAAGDDADALLVAHIAYSDVQSDTRRTLMSG